MLRTLRVSDLAIIEELELEFEPGLNVLTGETGSGKSILLQALDVVLGGRPDADLVRSGAEEAVVEALFTGLSSPAGSSELLVRRVIARGGRTKVYVNGALSSLPLLRELAPHLVRAYGQDEHQALRRVESHRELLDAVGGLGSTVDEMRQRHARLTAAREVLTAQQAKRARVAEQSEMLRFQHDELERANLVLDEEATLGAERVRLVHAERLAGIVSAAEGGIYSGEGAAVDMIGRALASLRDAERLDPSLGPTRALLDTALAELEDASGTLGRYLRDLAPDPERLDVIESRLADLARLKRKYGTGTVDDLIRRRDQITAELAAAGEGDEGLKALEAEVEVAEHAAVEWAKRLAVERRRVAHNLEKALGTELKALALDGARFAVRFADAEGRPLGPAGWDEVEFFLSANAGEELRPLARVASGGELSRIMLAVKTLAAADERGATLIFDEVDAGIGGAVAEVVARKLQLLGRRRQVLCVTHLPIIAAFAEHHIAVAKRVVSGRTVSSARPLSANERVAELARMLGGAKLTREAREHAEQLLRQVKAPAGRGASPVA
jgi:DNA repair protein RecN (Recombination protein N)